MTPPQRDHDKWHLDRKVPISIILALTAQFGAGIWYAGRIEARLSQLEHERITQGERDARQDATVTEAARQLQGRLDKIDEKLDRLIERKTR